MTRLRDEGKTPEELSARAGHVRGMLDHVGWHFVVADLVRKEKSLEEEITKGELVYEDYLRYSSELKGIRYALDLPEKLIGEPQGGPEE